MFGSEKANSLPRRRCTVRGCTWRSTKSSTHCKYTFTLDLIRQFAIPTRRLRTWKTYHRKKPSWHSYSFRSSNSSQWLFACYWLYAYGQPSSHQSQRYSPQFQHVLFDVLLDGWEQLPLFVVIGLFAATSNLLQDVQVSRFNAFAKGSYFNLRTQVRSYFASLILRPWKRAYVTI